MSKTLLIVICMAMSAALSAAQQKVVTAAQVNGLYTNRWSDFRILALGHHKLRVQFNGEYMTTSGVPNLGIADGEASIDGNVATFIPGDTTGCKITLTFLRNKMKVEQEGSDAACGFGHNVFATGTYRRIRAGKPKFVTYP